MQELLLIPEFKRKIRKIEIKREADEKPASLFIITAIL
jgi:hypothetical protein